MKFPTFKKKIYLNMEMIDFQHGDTIGADMELVLTELQRKIVDNAYVTSTDVQESKEVRDLANLIFDRFGLRVKIVTNSNLAAILPFYANRNHVFLHKFLRGALDIGEQTKVLSRSNNAKGTVNRAKARVGGFFSECENQLYLNFRTLFKTVKLSVSEATAVILHELGHAFHNFEYSDRLESSNQVMQDIAQELKSKKKDADVTYIYRELKEINPKVTAKEVEDLVTGSRVVAGLSWFRIVAGTVEEQLTNSKYSETSFENLADNFASRMGYGRSMLTALDKLGTTYSLEGMTTFSNIMTTLVFFVYTGLAIFLLVSGSFAAGIFISLLMLLVFRASGEDLKDYTYDELRIRYKRVRNSAVEALKDTQLDAETTKNLLEDINAMDRLINSCAEHSTILNKLANVFFSAAGSAKASIAEQQIMEDLASNDLFVASARLRTIHD